jgi:HEAT repeat protein
VQRYLSDPRWFVVRYMIVLLRAVNDRTALGDVRRLAHHGDLRVRLEAIKTLLALEPSVPRALLESVINDRDPKMAETAVTLVGNYGIKEAVGPLVEILKRTDILGTRRPVRLRAIKALGELAVPSALSSLERFFKDPFLPWPVKDERRAAFETLAAYPVEVRAPFVELGLRSRDPQIREICRRLSS